LNRTIDIHLFVSDLHRVSADRHHPLDEILAGILREFKYNDVPFLGLLELVYEFIN
jgi:hypothetical protein